MADQRIQHTEEMVGNGHGTKADTLNRHALIQHENDGTHKSITMLAGETILVGDSTSRAIGGANPSLQVNGITTNNSIIGIYRGSADVNGPGLFFAKGRDALGTYTTAVSDNDILGTIDWHGADTVDMATKGASIFARVYGTPGANDLPTELVQATTKDGEATPTEWSHLLATGRTQLGAINNIEDIGLTVTSDFVGYAAALANQGNNTNRSGIQVDAGADAGGVCIFFNARDGNGDATGTLDTTAGHVFQLSDVSDERTKDNWRPTELNGLEIINGLEIGDFEQKKGGVTVRGAFLAQQALKIYDEMVSGAAG